MDRSQAEAIVLAHAGPLKDFLGLTDWKVHYEFRRIEESFSMLCDLSGVDYQQATVTVDWEYYKDETALLNGLFHELCHVLHAPFFHYRKIAEAFQVDLTEQIAKVEQWAWAHAAEGFVLRMEWLWRNRMRDQYLDECTRPENHS